MDDNTTLPDETQPLRPYKNPFDQGAVVASAVILSILFVLGLFGNILTIIVIKTSKRLRGVFNVFILSLCVSDLSSAVISPLFLYRRTWGYNVWEIPSFFCKLYWSIGLWTSYVTAMHILVFAILRLISIRWAPSYTKITLQNAQICIAIMWAIGFFVGFIPFVMWFDASERPRNTDLPDARWPACTLEPEWSQVYSVYQKIAFPVFFFVPTLLIIILTVVIGVVLSLRQNERSIKLRRSIPVNVEGKLKKHGRKEREAMAQLSLIAGSFVLGYIPFSVYEIASMLSQSQTAADERYWWKFGMAEYICLRISETLNPVFYNLASRKMRAETITTLRKFIGIFCPHDKLMSRNLSHPSFSSSGDDGLPTLKSLTASNDRICENPQELPSISPTAVTRI